MAGTFQYMYDCFRMCMIAFIHKSRITYIQCEFVHQRRRHKRLQSILLRVECVYRQRHPIVFWLPLRTVCVRGARETVRRTNCEHCSFAMRLRSIFVILFIFESCMMPVILKPISSVGKCNRRNKAHGKYSEQNSIRSVVDQ